MTSDEDIEAQEHSGSSDPTGGGQGPGVKARARDRGTSSGKETSGWDPNLLPHPTLGVPIELPAQTPLFHATHAGRYERQQMIATYEATFDCRLVVLIDAIFDESVTYFEELLFDLEPGCRLHVMLDSPGGDGEIAVRLVRAAQARCAELTVIVPNQAKSAATLLAIGAHKILMGPASDLGPVDPQFSHPTQGLFAAKDLIAAVDAAEKAVAANPDTYLLHAPLLAEFNGVMVQQARSALARSSDLLREALQSNPDRTAAKAKTLAASLKRPLIDAPKDHGAIFGAADAKKAGLDVTLMDPRDEQWRWIWMLWAKYFHLDKWVYEGRLASHVVDRSFGISPVA